MPLRLTLFEHILTRLNVIPTPLVDTPLAPGIAKVLVTACELDLFDTLDAHRKQGMSLEDIAHALHCEPQGLQLLLHLLISTGYLKYRENHYFNTALTRRWLISASSVSIAPYILHSPDIVAIWDHMPEVIRTNAQAMRMPYAEDASDPATQRLLARHYAGLASLATALGREITLRVRLPRGAKQLLDVGGSHGAYSALFCRKYPHLHATIMDIQPGIEAGRRTAKLMKLEDRMDFLYADIVQDDFSQQLANKYDVALYFHIAHLLPPELNQATLAKVAATLRPGGMLIYVDQVTGRTSGLALATLMVQFMALTVTAIGGTCYPFTTVKQWLEEVGLGEVRSHRLVTPGATLITAMKH